MAEGRRSRPKKYNACHKYTFSDREAWKVAGNFFRTMAGNIIIVEPKERFKRVSLDAIRNEKIDLFTLGLYTRLLVRGKDWNLNISGLSALFGVNPERIRKSVCLLEEEGFVRRECVRDEVTGKLGGWNYFIYADAVPENERTALRKNRNTVKPPLRKNRITEKPEGTIILDTTNRLDNTNKPEDIDKGGKFNFRKAIVDLGVPEDIVADWLQVRKKKNASDTQTAFNKIKKEIEKSGLPAADCIRICAENSWRGFEAEWLQNRQTPPPRSAAPPSHKTESLVDHYRRVFAEINGTDNGTATDNPDEQ